VGAAQVETGSFCKKSGERSTSPLVPILMRKPDLCALAFVVARISPASPGDVEFIDENGGGELCASESQNARYSK
jgi:hypothetical protein